MNQNSTTTDTNRDGVHHSKPIPISTEHLRHRSTSFSSDLSYSPTSPPLVTPKNFPTTPIPVASSSPILQFLSQSPTKAPATFPFRGFAPPPVLEDEPVEEFTHARHTSTAGRFQAPPPPPAPEPLHERGVNVLRRLSLGAQRSKHSAADMPQPGIPSPPPNSAVSSSPIMHDFLPKRKARRSATVTEHTRPRRAPSPMGERILKGHFDGFN